MKKVINPKTNKPYSQEELQTAYENGSELEYYIKVPDGELLFAIVPHKEYVVDKQGFEKEIYTI